MAAGGTYIPIATTTLSTAASSITFSSIPSTYTDLVLVAKLTRDNAGSPIVRFNGDTSSNYSATYLDGNGTTVISSRSSNVTVGYINYNSDPVLNGILIVDLLNYSNTTTYKTYLANGSNAGNAVDRVVGLWRSTSAISTILLAAENGGNYFAGGTATLYGIAAA
jgi:hypothetical protein